LVIDDLAIRDVEYWIRTLEWGRLTDDAALLLWLSKCRISSRLLWNFKKAGWQNAMLVTWLLVVRGKDVGQLYKLTPGQTLTIGRDKSNEIRLLDDEVSRRHAEILVHQDNIEIVDLESLNGTTVNGELVSKIELQPGNEIRIGQTCFLLTSDAYKRGFPDAGLHGHASKLFESDDSEDSEHSSSVSSNVSDKWVRSVKSNLQFMYGAAIATGHASEVDQMLEKILDLIFDWINVERGCIYLWDSKSKKYRPRATRYRSSESKNVELRIGRSIIKYVRDRKEGIIVFDSPDENRGDGNDSILMAGVREGICAPIRGRAATLGFIYADRLCGGLDAGSDEPQFSEDHLKLIVAIGYQVAVFIENAEHYSALVEGERLTAVGRTLVALSHRIKNILQSINGGTHLIEDGLKNNNLDIINLGWNIVKRNQRNMSNLVMDMVSFSKPSVPHRKSQDLNKTIETCIRNVTAEVDESKIKIHWEPNPDVASLYFDRQSIGRAIENVLRYILEAGGESGEGNILIQLRANSEIAKIIIKDDFQELKTQEINHFFQLFAAEGEPGNHGIGLAVARKILREHDGEISVSKRTKTGISFTLTFLCSDGDVEDSTGKYNVGLAKNRDRPDHEPKDETRSKPR
jgi:signal transduction histidine kinase